MTEAYYHVVKSFIAFLWYVFSFRKLVHRFVWGPKKKRWLYVCVMQPHLTSDCDLPWERSECSIQRTTSCEDGDKEKEMMTLPRILLQIPFAQWQRYRSETGLNSDLYSYHLVQWYSFYFTSFKIFLEPEMLQWLYTVFFFFFFFFNKYVFVMNIL